MSDPRAPHQPRTISVGASATVAQIGALRSEILAVLDASDEVVLDLSELTETDFTFFQTLCAAHREAHLRGKRLTVTGRNENVEAAGRSAGFMRVRGSLPGCLWVEADHG